MRALAALLLMALAVPAFAQEPADAPLAMQTGDPAPVPGVFLTTARAGRLYKECAEAKANAADLEKALSENPGTPVGTVALAAGIGVVVGFAITFLLIRK